jgi:predicted phage gp36 major capsid-like protein
VTKEKRESHDLTELPAEQIIAKADELSAIAESMRGKDAAGADRAAAAAQVLRDHVQRRTLAETEAANYARANAPREDDPEE